jgi:hypothetical protein
MPRQQSERIRRKPSFGEENDMTIAKISNAGLLVTAILVAVLWGIVVANSLTLRAAHLEGIRAMREIKSLQIQKQKLPSRGETRDNARLPPARLRFSRATEVGSRVTKFRKVVINNKSYL